MENRQRKRLIRKVVRTVFWFWIMIYRHTAFGDNEREPAPSSVRSALVPASFIVLVMLNSPRSNILQNLSCKVQGFEQAFLIRHTLVTIRSTNTASKLRKRRF